MNGAKRWLTTKSLNYHPEIWLTEWKSGIFSICQMIRKFWYVNRIGEILVWILSRDSFSTLFDILSGRRISWRRLLDTTKFQIFNVWCKVVLLTSYAPPMSASAGILCRKRCTSVAHGHECVHGWPIGTCVGMLRRNRCTRTDSEIRGNASA